MALSIIYARSENHCIGDQGLLPWNLPDEFTSFNNITDGKAIIMGRRSYEDHNCVLPNRLNIIVSRQVDYLLPAPMILSADLITALQIAADYSSEYFIIGGVKLILEGLSQASRVVETIVHAEVKGDTFLPPMDFSHYTSEIIEHHQVDEHHASAFTVWQHTRA